MSNLKQLPSIIVMLGLVNYCNDFATALTCGSAFGWYNMVFGVAAPSSVL